MATKLLSASWSTLIVIVLPLPTVDTPLPPVIVKVSESKSILSAPPESPWKSKSCAVTCESIYVLIALAEAIVVSVPATEDISVSNTPDFKLSNSILDKVLLSKSIILFVKVCDDVSCTISLFVMLAILVAVAALPVVEAAILSVWVVTNVCIWSAVAKPVPPFVIEPVTIANEGTGPSPFVIVNWFDVVVCISERSPDPPPEATIA